MGGKRGTRTLQIGGAVSVLYLVAMALWSWSEISDLFAMRPNEFGDLLAGVFSPLAFLWLVLGYFQQGEELRASVKALELQGAELNNSVEQQRALVDVSTRQLEAEYAARRSTEQEADRKAQPKFLPQMRTDRLDRSTSYNFTFQNCGARCSEVTIWVEDVAVATSEELSRSEKIEWQENFPNDQPLEPLDGYVSYFDERGNHRMQTFTIYPRESLFGEMQTYILPVIDRYMQGSEIADERG